MGNEKSVYELILEEKDKIINFQQNIINKLIKTNVIIVLILAIVMMFFTYSYFFSNYDYGTHITGDSNKTVENSEFNSSELDIK